MPVYNAEKTVLRAARSILESSFKELELVIINDGSTDATESRLEQLTDPRIRFFRRPHQGVAPAFNFGLHQSRAPYIARMDADDFSYPHRLEIQLRQLRSGSLDVIGGRVKIVDEHGRPVSSMLRYQKWVNSLLQPDEIKAYRYVESPLVNPTVMAKSEVFALEYWDNSWPEDYDLWLRVMQRGFRIGKTSEVVLDWIDSKHRITRNDSRYSRKAFDECKRHYLLEDTLKDVPTVDLWGAGKTGKPWFHWLRKSGVSVRRIIEVSPRKIGLRLHEVPIVDPDKAPETDGVPMIIAVGAAGARELILKHLSRRGYVAGIDAWFVA